MQQLLYCSFYCITGQSFWYAQASLKLPCVILVTDTFQRDNLMVSKTHPHVWQSSTFQQKIQERGRLRRYKYLCHEQNVAAVAPTPKAKKTTESRLMPNIWQNREKSDKRQNPQTVGTGKAVTRCATAKKMISWDTKPSTGSFLHSNAL